MFNIKMIFFLNINNLLTIMININMIFFNNIKNLMTLLSKKL